MAVTLCVLLTPTPGRAHLLVEYENQVLELLGRHGGHVVTRVRAIDPDASPFEVHIVEFASDEALAGYLDDPARAALTELRDLAIAASTVVRVEPA